MIKAIGFTDYRLTYLLLCIGVLSFALVQSLVNPVLPAIQLQFGTDQSTVTWALTAYLLSASVCTPILGRVGDRVGRKRVLVAALGALTAGSLLAAVAPTIDVLIAARVIQGAGGAVLPLGFAIIRDEFPQVKVASAVGAVGAMMAAGSGIGLVIAGPLVDWLGYRWLFWLPMILTALAAVATAVFVPESPERTQTRINPVAAALLSGWLVALFVAVFEGNGWGWTSPQTIGLLLLAAALFAVWIWVETTSAEPLVDMRLMRNPTIWPVNLTALLFGVGMYGLYACLPQLLQTSQAAGYGFGASITQSGLILLPQTIGSFAAGVVAGRLTNRLGAKALLVIGAGSSAVGMFTLALAHDQLWTVLVGSTLAGTAVGMAFASMSNLVVSAAPPEQTGVASGVNANIRTVGGALGTAAVMAMVTSQLGSNGVPAEAGYTAGFLVLAATATAATVVALVVRDPRLRVEQASDSTADNHDRTDFSYPDRHGTRASLPCGASSP